MHTSDYFFQICLKQAETWIYQNNKESVIRKPPTRSEHARADDLERVVANAGIARPVGNDGESEADKHQAQRQHHYDDHTRPVMVMELF